jgi:hypothetical protein
VIRKLVCASWGRDTGEVYRQCKSVQALKRFNHPPSPKRYGVAGPPSGPPEKILPVIHASDRSAVRSQRSGVGISLIRSLPAVAGNLRLCFYSVILCILSKTSDRIQPRMDTDVFGSERPTQITSAKVRSIRRKYHIPPTSRSDITPKLAINPGTSIGVAPPEIAQRKPLITPTIGFSE